ncbi:kinase-like domain-containing protein [Hypoxylon trugodes]|uniref:kinase-like domain-containing protein n=1 Tax=Hypoxylon trugodes TaxID=326681 RepID=UPI002196EC6F|nr:kinase-like domain-containing protein [Hypoxylon trugodes]KAI1390035.1 kinase-like domain-containing protein [Hypoxylon trugodes]
MAVPYGKLRYMNVAQGQSLLKEYEGFEKCDDVWRLWESETETYRVLHDKEEEIKRSGPDPGRSPFRNIPRYYWSFRQGSKATLVIEYANGETLKQYFKDNSKGLESSGCTEFWQQIFGLLDAIAMIHNNAKERESEGQRLARIHQDIKPENILLFYEGERKSGSGPPSLFKLTDFGRSHTRVVNEKDNDQGGRDNGANKMYSAPECCDIDGRRGISHDRVGPKADIWSIGAVFSETLVWSLRGEAGINQYWEKRCEQTKDTRLDAAGYGACFHDATARLKAVDQMHQVCIRDPEQGADEIFHQVDDIVLNHMLQPESNRLDAHQLLNRWHMRGGVNQLGPIELPLINLPDISGSEPRESQQQSGSPEISAVPEQVQHTGSSSIRMEDVENIAFLYEKLQIQGSRFRSKYLHVSPSFKQNESPSIQKEDRHLQRTEQIFLIDDTISMRHNKDAVCKTIRVFGKIAKQITPKNIPVLVKSASNDITVSTNKTKNLEKEVWDLIFDSNETDLNYCLGELVTKIVCNSQSATLFILTDGNWDSSTCQLHEQIKSLSKHIEDNNLDITKFSIQFILFGEGSMEKELPIYYAENYRIVSRYHYDEPVVSFFRAAAESSRRSLMSGHAEPSTRSALLISSSAIQYG